MNGFEHYSWWPSTGTCSLIASWPFQCHSISQTDSIHSFVRLERGKGLCFVDWVVMMEAMFILNRIDMMAHKIWERVDKPHNDNLFNRPEPRQQGPIQLCSATRVNLWPNINWQWGIVLHSGTASLPIDSIEHSASIIACMGTRWFIHQPDSSPSNNPTVWHLCTRTTTTIQSGRHIAECKQATCHRQNVCPFPAMFMLDKVECHHGQCQCQCWWLLCVLLNMFIALAPLSTPNAKHHQSRTMICENQFVFNGNYGPRRTHLECTKHGLIGTANTVQPPPTHWVQQNCLVKQ